AFQGMSGGSMDAAVAKFDANGARIWATYYGGTAYDIGSGISVDAQDDVYFAGSTGGGGFPVTTGSFGGGLDGFVVKLTSAGAQSWATYVGGNVTDEAYRVAVDTTGNIFVSGNTQSPNFPTTAGAFQTTFGGLNDGFLVKYLPSGAISWSTFLGGSADDYPHGIDTDAAGNLYVSGYTGSTNFPTSNAFQNTHAGGVYDAFVSKFATGGNLLWSTFYGGTNVDVCLSIAVDQLGDCYFTGRTFSNNYPVTAGAYQTTYGATNFTAFLTKLSSGGAQLWSTYLGGSTWQKGVDIAIGPANDVYVTGDARSTNFPVTPDAVQSMYGGGTADVFISKFTPAGAFTYSTYYGGSSNDYGIGIGSDASGAFYVVGYTESNDFPTLNPYQNTYGGNKDAFLLCFADCGVLATQLNGLDTIYYCQGSNLILDAGPGFTSYQWSTSDTSRAITTMTSGLFYVDVADSAGCMGSDTVFVQQSAVPTAQITPNGVSICAGDSITLNSVNTATSYQWYLSGSPIAGATGGSYTVTMAGDYTLVLSNPPNCSDSTTNAASITVTTPPTLNLGPDVVACDSAGVIFDLSGGNFSSLLWCDGSTGTTYTAMPPETVCVTVFDQFGCPASDTVVVTTSSLSADFSHVTNLLTASFTDNSTAATTWAWDFGDGNTDNSQNPSHTYAMDGNYAVCLLVGDSLGCFDSTCITVAVVGLGLVDENVGPVRVYPQPASQDFVVDWEGWMPDVTQLAVFDALGRVVVRKEVAPGIQSVKMEAAEWAAGTYVLRLRSGGQQVMRKIVVR
ncbi:MAG: SBBP repeat-containing protein, partial [Bacteroidota bacterium]